MRRTPPLAIACTVLSLLAPTAHAVDHGDLLRLAERYSRQLPRMVARDLREEGLVAKGMTLVYTYTHLSYSERRLRSMNLEVTRRAAILPGLCASADTRRMLREGVRFQYVYRAANGHVGGIVDIQDSDCRRGR